MVIILGAALGLCAALVPFCSGGKSSEGTLEFILPKRDWWSVTELSD